MARKILFGGLCALTLLVSFFTVSAITTTSASAAEEVSVPIKWPDGRVSTIVTHNRHWPKWMSAIGNNYDIDYVVLGGVTQQHRDFVAVAKDACTEATIKGEPNAIVDILGNTIVFGILGWSYGGIVAQANSAFKGMEATNSAAVGTSDALGGTASGILGQGKRNITFWNCATNAFETIPDVGVHVMTPNPY